MKKIVLTFILLILFTCAFAQTPFQFVYDQFNHESNIANWLSTIDELYATYDMITNSWTQIENQIVQIKNAVENCKNVDWTNVNLNGGFDIRDDLLNVGRRVNSYLNQVQQIKNTLTTTIIEANGVSYSLADLFGKGDEDKSFGTAVDDIYSHFTVSMHKAANYAVGNLTEQQAKAIYSKYGVSPMNYYLINEAAKSLRDTAKECISQTTIQARELKRKEVFDRTTTYLKGVLETKTSDGTIAENAINEGTMYLLNEVMVQNEMLGSSVDNAAALVAKIALENQKKEEANASTKYANDKSDEFKDKNLPANFTVGTVNINPN